MIRLKIKLALVAIALLKIMITACSNQAVTNTELFSKIHVRWNLVQNTKNEKCIAEFLFFNSGKTPLKNGDWALYFNQNTLRMGKMNDANKGVVEHVNGDLYRFYPGEDFILNPGDSLKIRYSYRGVLIKERDSPIGAYFANRAKNKKGFVVLPGKFVTSPFNKLSAIFPNPDVLSTVPNANNEFDKNIYLKKIPVAQIGKILPTPFSQKLSSGSFHIDESTVVFYENGLENEAKLLSESVQKLFGTELPVSNSFDLNKKAIRLNVAQTNNSGISSEAYRLSAKTNDIEITGSDAAGVFYGIQSLLSLMWAGKDESGIRINCIDVRDVPRFAYRGFLLDVARNFQKKEDVMRLIDLLAMYKINKLNIRISDDEGWRIEINGLPELTEVGSKRGHTYDSENCLTPSFGSGPFPDSENNYGNGFYTREEFKEILKYAHDRHIQVIPEVCFPSHARAAIKAMEARYNKFMEINEVEKANEFRLIDPEDQSKYLSAQMYKDNIVCVALPSVYNFYEKVVHDFVNMYEEAGLKLTTFNTGGDEVPRGAWAKSPLCNNLMKNLPDIADPSQLQGYFFEKALDIFDKYKLQVSGWEEIVLNKDSSYNISINPKFLDKNVLPLVWDNTSDNIDLGYRIANAGYNVVLCNVTNLYFDLAYNTDPKEPGLYWGGFQDAIDPYMLVPYDVYKTTNFDDFGRLTERTRNFGDKQVLLAKNNIVGIQAQLWSETIKGADMMEYYLVPKLFAFAEKAWSKAPEWEKINEVKKRNSIILTEWNKLANTIGHYELSKIDKWFKDYNYRISPPGAIIEDGILKANVAFPGLTIRYSTNGEIPDKTSMVYSVPVKVNEDVKIRAFSKKGRGGKSFTVRNN